LYSQTGKPGVDPVVIVKMALLGYLYGITSERRLAEEARLNLAFMWFLGYDLDERPPDHSVLSKARRRFGVTVYQAFFVELVRQCERAGLIEGQRLYVDSTLVAANANRDGTCSRTLLTHLEAIQAHVAAVWHENPEGPTVAGAGLPDAPSASPTEVRPTLHRCSPDDPPSAPAGRANALARSRSDPDAALLSREGVPLDLYHKVHVGVDGGTARVITALEVSPADVADFDLLDRVCKEHQGITRRHLREVITDGRYSTYAVYRLLEEQGMLASIPVRAERYRQMTPDQFVYEAQADRYVCPQGQRLTRQGISHGPTGIEFIQYRASPKDCGPCPIKSACCGRSKARTLTPLNDGGLSERVRAYLRTAHAKRSLQQRKCWVELVFAELKERHGGRRARGRGRDAMLLQALGMAMAYNIKKLVKVTRQWAPLPALSLHPRPLSALCSDRRSWPQPYTFSCPIHFCI
jgi:transposase